jgi:TRAP-type mannitol/chloroaromatic compound transport system permease small subunit
MAGPGLDPARPVSAFWHPAVVGATRAGAWAGGVLMLIATLLICLDVVLRAAHSTLTVDSFELSAYCFAIAYAISLPHSLLSGAHIRINLMSSVRVQRVRQVADVLALASLAGFASWLAWYGVATVRESSAYKVVSNSTLAVPLALPQALWAAGLVAFAAVSCFGFVRGALWLLAHRNAEIESAATIREDDLRRESEAPL